MDVYERIGVKKLVNAYGTVTRIGGSRMRPEVLAAMADAARSFVDLDELLEKAGEHIARLLGADGAFITTGAAGGLLLSGAACIVGTDPQEMTRLPYTEGMKNEIVIFKGHRNAYDFAFRQVGAKLVEIGVTNHVYPWELEAAISENTAAVAHFAAFDACNRDDLPLEKVIEISHKAGLPVIVNAAAELPPVENLTRFTKMGADLVVFSGGKDLRGPQCTGLILGRRDLIRACALNSNPNHGIGRALKVGKEEIVGLVTAIELYLEEDQQQRMNQWESQVADVLRGLEGLPCIRARRVCPSDPGIQPTCVPRVYVDLDESRLGLSRQEFRDALRKHDPSVVVGLSSNGIVINPQMLTAEEHSLVIDAIRDVVHKVVSRG